MNLRTLRSRGGLPLLAAVGYVLAAFATVAVLVWFGLAPAQRALLREGLSGQTPTIVLGLVLAVVGLVAVLGYFLGRYPATAGRLAADTRLILGANAHHRLDLTGPAELRELASAVNDLAERRHVAEGEVARQVAAGRAEVEQERNRLAALMADLDVAVLVCSLGGRVLLYNAAARSLLADDPALGLGRSVFGIVDRGLVTHALARIQDDSARTHASTVLREGRLLHIRLSAVRDAGGDIAGYVLVLEDLTSRQRSGARREAILRELIETTRGSLASIRAAVETVLDYPAMDADQRGEFVGIVREEAVRLGHKVDEIAEPAADGGDWLLTDLSGEDLLSILGREVDIEDGVTTAVEPGPDELWVRVDSHALARAVVRLVTRLRDLCSVHQVVFSLTRRGRHAGLDIRWTGRPPDADVFTAWLDEPLGAAASGTVQEVVERHDGEIWAGDGPHGSAYVRMLLPLSDSGPERAKPLVVTAGSRPELYDFDLFDRAEESLTLSDRKLSDLAYTVFDTETTGLDPAGGDEIVAIGAVRVVNSRLLRRETFERLVDPRRSIPRRSTEVHGITADMVRGQPTLDQVLALFSRFAAETILVGHNVGFDMSFLRRKEEQTGVRFTQPVLDTLLLDAVLHPEHEEHSIESIAARLGVDVVGRHTALGDALVAGEVFVRQLGLLQRQNITTLSAALNAANATYHARLDARLYQR